jgi:hypothetical protein
VSSDENDDYRQPHSTLRGGPSFRPVAILSLIYFAVFFMTFALLLVMPELNHVFKTIPEGPGQHAAAQEAVHAVVGPRFPVAFVLALAATAAGAYFKQLPGLRK